MLGGELSGCSFSKAKHNRALQELIPRSRGSIELKHQNIGAVLLGLNERWIDGYKPAVNFQNALVDGVLRWLNARPDWLAPKADSVPSLVRETSSLWIEPPPAQGNEPLLVDPAFMAAIGRMRDVAERDARNRRLGKAGEKPILHHERQSLSQAGRGDLAGKVRWTAEQDGDGFGYDSASFEPDGRERMIEVKTTHEWERSPFHITRNELAVAETRRDDRHLVQV